MNEKKPRDNVTTAVGLLFLIATTLVGIGAYVLSGWGATSLSVGVMIMIMAIMTYAVEGATFD